MRIWASIVIVAAMSGPALAKPLDLGVFGQATEVVPSTNVARSRGIGVEAALVPMTASPAYCEYCVATSSPTGPFYFGVGAFATQSEGGSDKPQRDLYDLRGSVGVGKGPQWLIPFVTVGLDALYVTTRLPAGGHHAGVTLGGDVRAGILGYVGSHGIYAVSASYLGAVAPGTGDNAGGWVLQVALGWRFILEH